MRNKKGLTLIELLAVIAIIAILFILLVPQVTKAVDKSKVSGVQVDLHSYEIGMRSYFTEHFGEEKTVEKLNTYLDKALQFELVDGKYLSKKETNAYKNKYELTSDWETYMQVNSYTDEPNPRVHAVRVYEEGNEVKSMYIGFDEEKRKSDIDTEAPSIIINPNGGQDIEEVAVEVTDNVGVFNIQYVWTNKPTSPTQGWKTISNNTELTTVFLGKGTYYLHVKASDLDMNSSKVTSLPYELGDSELPVIKLTVNGSGEQKIKHTTVVNVTDNKGVLSIKYVWSDSQTKPTNGWQEVTTGKTITTDNQQGDLYLHIEAIDTSGNIANFVSESFNTGDTEAPSVKISVNGSTTLKDSYEPILTVTDNDELGSVRYVWSVSQQRPSEGWINTTNGAKLKTPMMNGDLYLHIEAIDRSGNKTDFVSKSFKTGDDRLPNITLSPNGNTTVATSHTTVLKVTDNKGVKEIKYVWSNSTEIPTSGWKTTVTGTSLTSPTSDDNMYLHVKAEDVYGNIKELVSNAFAQSPFTYTVDQNGTTITGYRGNKTDLVIPRQLGGKNVTTLGSSAFNGKGLTSVELPDTLETIGQLAFRSNKLTELTLPNSVMKIEKMAFSRNELTEVKMSEGLLEIGSEVFRTNQLTTLKITSKVTTLGDNIAYDNGNLQTIQNCSSIDILADSPGALTIGPSIPKPTVTNEGC